MIVTVASIGLATVQDGGRPGRMHEGVPPGGALSPEHLAAANLALGNAPDAPAVEHFGRLIVSCEERLVAATPDELVELCAEPRALEPRRRAGYLAVPGGFEMRGRLRRGDALRVRGGGGSPRPPAPPASEGPLRVIPGPDAGDLDALLAAELTVSPVGDRVGVRLVGPPVAATPLESSAPMVRGAIQVTPSGELVVLGPDHPTTGGYPVIAVVASADVGRLFMSRPGERLRFVVVK